mgnify:CR=1 FL=1
MPTVDCCIVSKRLQVCFEGISSRLRVFAIAFRERCRTSVPTGIFRARLLPNPMSGVPGLSAIMPAWALQAVVLMLSACVVSKRLQICFGEISSRLRDIGTTVRGARRASVPALTSGRIRFRVPVPDISMLTRPMPV